MEKREILSLLEEGGGITLGHFARNREWHADLQVGKYLGFHNPEATEKLCAKLLKSFDGKSFDIIVVRSVAEDLILGYACGRALNLKVLAVFKDEGLVSLVPQYNIQAGSKALVVANSFRTEDSLRATIAALTSPTLPRSKAKFMPRPRAHQCLAEAFRLAPQAQAEFSHRQLAAGRPGGGRRPAVGRGHRHLVCKG